MTHPAIRVLLDYLSYSNDDIERIFLEHDGYSGKSKILFYSSQKEAPLFQREVSAAKLREILGIFLKNYDFSLGIDNLSLYNNHRQIRYLRLVLPESLLSIDFDDEKINLAVEGEVTESLRSMLCITNSELF